MTISRRGFIRGALASTLALLAAKVGGWLDPVPVEAASATLHLRGVKAALHVRPGDTLLIDPLQEQILVTDRRGKRVQFARYKTHWVPITADYHEHAAYAGAEEVWLG